eukprot:764149-Hanusia_phi.AAC.2
MLKVPIQCFFRDFIPSLSALREGAICPDRGHGTRSCGGAPVLKLIMRGSTQMFGPRFAVGHATPRQA